jgi:hypothetical protein
VQCRYRYKQLMKDTRFADMQRAASDAAAQFAQTAPSNAKVRQPVASYLQPVAQYWPPIIEYFPYPMPPPDAVRPIKMVLMPQSGMIIYQNRPLCPVDDLRARGSVKTHRP